MKNQNNEITKVYHYKGYYLRAKRHSKTYRIWSVFTDKECLKVLFTDCGTNMKEVKSGIDIHLSQIYINKK